jgi:sodium/hydrogen exchanger 8
MLGRRLDEDDGTHEFHALNTLLLVVVLGLCLLSAYLIKKYRFYFMPESSAALCVGLVVGGIARLITHSDEELDFLSFSPELFFFLLLPPIIFEAGYTLRRKNFFRNLGTITMYAVVGTLISTFVVGYFTYACARAGIVDVDATNPMEALLFGALISAVDPVATLSIMGSPELNCDPLLYSLVFGESVLNDAVAIVLFRTFYNYYEEGAELDQSKIPVALFEFLFVTIGSILMGVATGLICSYLFRHTRIRDYPKYEISLLFLFAYGAYALAESIELSGIMALFFCGIVLAHYNSYNLSKTSQTTAEEIFAALSTVAESFVFMYMGMGFFTGRFKTWGVRRPFLVLFAAPRRRRRGDAIAAPGVNQRVAHTQVGPHFCGAGHRLLSFRADPERLPVVVHVQFSKKTKNPLEDAGGDLVRRVTRRHRVRAVAEHARPAQGRLRDHDFIHSDLYHGRVWWVDGADAAARRHEARDRRRLGR